MWRKSIEIDTTLAYQHSRDGLIGGQGGQMPGTSDFSQVAQTREESIAFIEAFARVNVEVVRETLRSTTDDALWSYCGLIAGLDWSNPGLLAESGLRPDQIDERAQTGMHYLHIDVAVNPKLRRIKDTLLSFTGLSVKLQRNLFPAISSNRVQDRRRLTPEVARLNLWLDWVRRDGFDPSAFVTYQRSLRVHGRTQNLSGAIGAIGAAIAFIDAIEQIDPNAILNMVGCIPPHGLRSPENIHEWMKGSRESSVKSILLKNGRSLVFATSKDANIFLPLNNKFSDAREALTVFSGVQNDQAARSQIIHEFAVGEIKTATDPANLHERMGLASRETQTELRTDRFLMMSVLNEEILSGGVQRRVMNNRDLTRFSHIFNLHHCWGYDGGRDRHESHWKEFVTNVGRWCGL